MDTDNVDRLPRLSWFALLACVVLTPLATTATSLTLESLPLTYESFVLPKLAALGLTAAVALALWAISARGVVRWNRAAWAVAAFVTLAALATAFGLDPAVAVFGRDAANGLIAYVAYAIVFFLVLQHVSGASRLRSLARALAASGVVAAFATLLQAALMTPARVEALGLGDVGFLYGRGGGLFGNPDFAGAFFVAPLLLAAGLVLAEKTAQWRIGAGVAAAIIGAALVVTQVRAGWVGAFAGLLLLGVLVLAGGSARTKKLLAIVGAGLAVALMLGAAIQGPSLLLERFGVGAGEGLDAVSSGRLTGWGDALAVIAQRPITGTGPDSFTLGWYGVADALANPTTGERSYFEDPHNVLLAVAATMGAPAALALLALAVLAVLAGVKGLRQAPPGSEGRLLVAAWLAAFCGLLVTSLFAVTTIPTVLLLFVSAGALLALGARTAEYPRMSAVVATAGALTAAVVLVTALVPIVADYHLGQHMRSGSMESLERARSIAPWEKTIQLRYIDVREAQVVPLLDAGGTEALTAVGEFDNELFALIERHPHELLYTLRRLELLGRSAGMLGPAIGEKNLAVVNLTLLDYPQLEDLKVYKARALNNLDRYDEARAVLDPMPRSVQRDIALAETLLLLKDQDATRTLVRDIAERYPASPLAQAFLRQPTIRPLLAE